METEDHAFRIEDIFPFLDPYVSKWFDINYRSLTEPQKYAIPFIHEGRNVLVSSPTGTGKTLTAFLSIINELFMLARSGKLEDKIYCVYISPLKALANDVNKNLRAPLEGIYKIADEDGINLPKIRVSVRSGDTSEGERQKMARKPPHILITTPESFSLTLSSPRMRENLRDVKYVIIDEIHEISSTKRGSLLSANMERLEALRPGILRIGLSATQSPIEEIAKYLVGFSGTSSRPCEIVEVKGEKYLDLKTITPVPDLTKVSYEVANDRMYDIIADLVKQYRTTLIFTNTRSGTEHVALRLRSRGIESLEAHHSSMGKEQRVEVENKLKNGELKCVITSTSLELGVDIGYIDLVIQIGSPKSVSKGLQRIGRSGHGINELSKGIFIVFNLDDLVECAVLTRAAYDRHIDRVDIPKNPLDVLAQVLVGMAVERVWDAKEAYEVLRSSYTFHTLSWDDYVLTLEYLSGELENLEIYPKIWFDKEQNSFGKKKSTRMIYFMNVGTIPDEANYKAINEKGKSVGELSDKFVERLKPGDVFVLGARTYIFERTVRNRVYVRSVTGMKPTVPSWTGEMLPRSYDLGVLIGEFRKTVSNMLENGEDPTRMLIERYHVDENGARSIISYIKAQKQFSIPTEDHLFVEGLEEPDGVFGAVFHVPLGRKVNDALSRSYALAISNKYQTNTRITVTDDGFIIYSENKIPLGEAVKLINSENLEDYVRRAISNTELFKQRFRHCAARSLMILRSYKGYDISVARQQLRSDKLLNELQKHQDFSIIKETYREIMEDIMDVPRAIEYVKDVIDRGAYTIRPYSRETSPFSYGMIMAGSSDIVMMEDRSKMLKELQGRMLEKIYGTTSIAFLFDNQKNVDEYFKRKIPRVYDLESLVRFANHFPYIDVLKERFNSPYSYANTDIKNIVENAINLGLIKSVYVRGVQWCSFENYPYLRSLFRRSLQLEKSDSEVLSKIDGQSFSELRDLTKMGEEELRKVIGRLESAFLIERKFRNGMTIYVKNEDDRYVSQEEALSRLLIKLLGSYGPSTLEEIEIKIPFDEDTIKSALDALISSGQVVYDYITPVYSKQYMLSSDIEAMTKTKDVVPWRFSKITKKVQNIEQYFDLYGFAFDEGNIISRLQEKGEVFLDPMVRAGYILKGHFIKSKVTYISRWLIDVLYTLRDHEVSQNEEAVLEAIKSGYTEEKISEKLNMEKRIVRQIIRSLEYKMMVGKSDSELVITDARDIGRGKALEKLIEAYGPITLEELRKFFWFNPDISSVDKEKVKSIFYNGQNYYFSGEKPDDQWDAVLTLNDPVNMYMQIYTDNIDYNRILLSKGRELATFYLEERDGVYWISSLSMYGDDGLETTSALRRYFNSNPIVLLDSSSIKSYSPDFSPRGNVLLLPEGETIALDEKEILKYSFEKVRKQNRSHSTLYEAFSSIIFGLREFIEALRYGLTETNVENYFDSSLLYLFNGPYDKQAYATRESISIYRSLRSYQLTKEEQQVIKFIMGVDSATEREIERGCGLESAVVKAATDRLFKYRILARNFERKYFYVQERYSTRDALKIIIDYSIRYFGFITPSRMSTMIGVPESEIYSIASSLKNIKRFYNVITRELYFSYWDISEPSEHSSEAVQEVVSGKDIFVLFYSDYFRMIFGGSFDLFLYSEGEFRLAANVSKVGHYMKIKKYYGNEDHLKLLSTKLKAMGYSLISRKEGVDSERQYSQKL
ncbi:hypothetical protein large helicase related protein LHR homolog [Thermoplasma volcanium GSS1]|uniref:ATP-dependent helicase n=1 Tax=Thermoplasma volcanium (strain ATCC 51530 / DSM 4299 / JCM 9571 / NBRC 15438 / GSS1) TaxID=273116 RepID=Q97B15_THEVO|nr:ATP-dependent helicase [Thermoplasma volcanium]BAB59786.1 hypothetical protein large helicase related protein LHR homolog [Thermoplasma volcanium GSS1]